MLLLSRISLIRLLLLCCLLSSVSAESLPSENAQLPPSFRPLIQRSGYIFAGTVLAVENPSPLPNEIPIVRVTFHVDEAIRGFRQGQTLTIREWSGSWNSSGRYHRGQRLLLFLYSPNKLGLTSPVTNNSAQFELNTTGDNLLNGHQMPAQPSRLDFHRSRNVLPRNNFIEALR